MRILFLAKHLSPGGVNTHMLQLGSSLVRRGHSVALASRGHFGEHPLNENAYEAAGIRHVRVPFPSPLLSINGLSDHLRSNAALGTLVRDFHPDLMHSHWRLTSHYARRIRRLHGIPCVTSWHGGTLRRHLLNRRLAYPGDQAVAVGDEMRKLLVDGFGFPPSRVQTVPNGVDSKHFRPPSVQERLQARIALGVERHALVLCMVASFYPGKRHDLALEALVVLREQGCDAALLLAGSGPQRAFVETMVAQRGLMSSTRFLGYCDSREVYWASDVQIYPTEAEAFPIAPVEGMLCGVPIVRTPAGGISEQVIEGETGYVVPFNDAAALAERLVQLHEEQALRRTLSERAREHAAANFDAERMVETYERIYHGVLGSQS